MKRFALCLVLCGLSAAHAQSLPIKISVERQQKIEREVKQKASEKSVSEGTVYHPQLSDRNQEVVFRVKLQSVSGRDWKGLRVKYALLSRDLKNKKAEIAASGEESVDLRPLGIQTFQTKAAKFTSQETRYSGRDLSQSDQLSGQKLYGIAVVVYEGAKRIATLYEPQSIEREMSGLDKEF